MLKESKDFSDFFLLIFFSFLFRLLQENCLNVDIFNQIHALSDKADLLWEDLLRNYIFQDCSSKKQKEEVQFQHISKKVSDFLVGQERRSTWHLRRS